MHGKNYVGNTGHTNIIFKKNKDGSYTRNALLYQDILKYCINGKYKENDDKSFRLWKLTKWLLEANTEFINYFKELSTRNYTVANRIENRLPRIKSKVEDLVNLGLIAEIGPAKESKGTGTTTIYEFTIVGKIVAWIIESMNIHKRQYAIDELYNLFQNNFKGNPSSTDTFNSIFYQKCKEYGLFENFIDRYRELLESETLIINTASFFQRLLIVPKPSTNSKMDLWTLWYDSVSQLDPRTKYLLFHHIKLEIEKRAEGECHAFREFEKVRFETRKNPSFVALEGYCKNCSFYTPAALKLNEYIEQVLNGYHTGVILVACPNCNNNDSLEFPILI